VSLNDYAENAYVERKSMRAYLIGLTAQITAGVDQLTKHYAIQLLTEAGAMKLTPLPFINLVYARNTGINFGLFGSESAWQPFALAGFAIAISLGLVYWGLAGSGRKFPTAIGLLVGGALGNAWDRIATGAVIDFINMDCCGIGNPYAFNIADAAIVGGVALIIFATWREEPEATAS
jgi:signal peptidase II